MEYFKAISEPIYSIFPHCQKINADNQWTMSIFRAIIQIIAISPFKTMGLEIFEKASGERTSPELTVYRLNIKNGKQSIEENSSRSRGYCSVYTTIEFTTYRLDFSASVAVAKLPRWIRR